MCPKIIICGGFSRTFSRLENLVRNTFRRHPGLSVSHSVPSVSHSVLSVTLLSTLSHTAQYCQSHFLVPSVTLHCVLSQSLSHTEQYSQSQCSVLSFSSVLSVSHPGFFQSVTQGCQSVIQCLQSVTQGYQSVILCLQSVTQCCQSLCSEPFNQSTILRSIINI